MALEIPYSVKPTNNVPVDFYYGPWASLAQARTNVPTSLRLNRTVGVITGGEIAEYWWKSATGDNDLVLKSDTTTAAGLAQEILDRQAADDDLQTQINGKQNALGFTPENAANKGATNGYAPLVSGLIPPSYLPSYVDDVEEYADFASLPAVGETGKIYVTLDDNKTYRWGGSTYVNIAASDVESVNGKSGVVILDKTDIGLGNVQNVDTTDADNINEGTNHLFFTPAERTKLAGLNGDTIIDHDIQVRIGASKSIGKYINGQTILSTGMTINEFLDDIATEVIHPTYTAPTASLAGSPAPTTTEVGTSLNITFTGTYNQNNGGAVTAVSLKRDGSEVATVSPSTQNSVVMTTTNKVFQITYTYAQGPILNNNLNEPDPVGQIPAGTTPGSNTLSYRGYYRIFFDASTAPSTSAGVRAAANTRFQNAGNTWNLNTGTTATSFWFWLPAGVSLTSVIDLDALNLNITSQYIGTSLQVNDAGGTPVNGTLYVMTQTVPYSTSHRHAITIA